MDDKKPKYYSELRDPTLKSKFIDLDQDSNYADCDKSLRDPDTRNFVVDFGSDGAWVARDVLAAELLRLLEHERPTTSLATRWINIFAPNRQQEAVKILAKHYAFSPRLCGIMCSDPSRPQPVVVSDPPSPTERFKEYARQKQQQFRASYEPQSPVAAPNPEDPVELRQVPPDRDRLDVNHYHIADEVWHWSSIDYGEKYLCLGYNWLHNVEEAESPEDELKDVPSGRRLWTWLIICGDGTVITLHEDPFPGIEQWPQRVFTIAKLSKIRRNLLNVFRNLSKAENSGSLSEAESAISTLHIRKADGGSAGDAPSLLFYYLFDDWYTTYSLVVRGQHKYGEKLRNLRQQLRERPGLEQLQEIHQIGRQLGVLKRVYASYRLIIDSIVQRQKPRNQYGTPDHQNNPLSFIRGQSFPTSPDGVLGPTLNPSAIVRFQRLGDRIDLYVLNEIQQCLDEKESLVFMAVERLTRTTILLAKLTILFLPVSLMTGYFSVQIQDLQGVYTHKTYWGCFGVLMFVSITVLFAFGWISGIVEGKVTYQPLSKKLWTAIKLAGKGQRELKW
ncbi:hypothetical protein FGG08_006716 [Glutinoglossum americanum]|uniref:ADP-ribosylation factor n=1 Tax=Glutinoglossum americanum TaxID=1670608 RepID=A0A9P8I0B8_9PEZI|nr:hypothetical protein FGG08_006716 [Glutinoglossum americanum]